MKENWTKETPNYSKRWWVDSRDLGTEGRAKDGCASFWSRCEAPFCRLSSSGDFVEPKLVSTNENVKTLGLRRRSSSRRWPSRPFLHFFILHPSFCLAESPRLQVFSHFDFSPALFQCTAQVGSVTPLLTLRPLVLTVISFQAVSLFWFLFKSLPIYRPSRSVKRYATDTRERK